MLDDTRKYDVIEAKSKIEIKKQNAVFTSEYEKWKW